VHIDVDTGIGRSGIAPGRLEELLRRVAAMGAVRVTGICTHFTAADSPDGGADVLAQQRFFESILRALQPELTTGLAVHAANSPGALRVHPGASSLIRPGLLLYGIAPSAQFEAAFEYEPVMTVRARALLVRELPAGSDISYNRTYRLPHDARVATIGIGYGDGYPRALSNSGQVIGPAGEVLPIRGRVCMDQLCVELPQECTMESGATVTVLGASAGRSITAAGIAQITGAAPHEMTTCLMPRVPRVWIGD
jgi:alanine racemase